MRGMGMRSSVGVKGQRKEDGHGIGIHTRGNNENEWVGNERHEKIG